MVTILDSGKDAANCAAELERLYALPDHHIVVLYHNTECPPCKLMMPAWTAACAKFKSEYDSNCKNKRKVVIANVDEKCKQHLNKVYKDVQGTPTIAHIHHDGTVTKYEGNRSEEAFLKWLNSTLGKHCGNGHSHNSHNSQGGRKKKSRSVRRIRRGLGPRTSKTRTNRSIRRR
jgi:thiol-disulfide isomerase/thioredoxin